MFTGRPLHLRNFDYVGEHRYFLTWCCHDRQTLFRQKDTVDLARVQILRAGAACDIATVAYCFMPDHLHLLVEGTHPTTDARRFVLLAKQYSGFAFSQRFQRRLWQRYGHEHVLRSHETSRRVARYIIENPVRAGLTASVAEWPHVGSGTHDLPALLEWAYSEPE